MDDKVKGKKKGGGYLNDKEIKKAAFIGALCPGKWLGQSGGSTGETKYNLL